MVEELKKKGGSSNSMRSSTSIAVAVAVYIVYVAGGSKVRPKVGHDCQIGCHVT